jgi:DNA-directed RNA polymerase subunit RPC12/RpoP
VKYKCPTCGEQLDFSALQRPAGITGGKYCPACQQRVSLSMPYGRAVAVISLLASGSVVTLLGVRNIVGFVVGTLLVWLPISMFLNLWSTRLKAPTLRKWEPSRQHRSFLTGCTSETLLRICSTSAPGREGRGRSDRILHNDSSERKRAAEETRGPKSHCINCFRY